MNDPYSRLTGATDGSRPEGSCYRARPERRDCQPATSTADIKHCKVGTAYLPVCICDFAQCICGSISQKGIDIGVSGGADILHIAAVDMLGQVRGILALEQTLWQHLHLCMLCFALSSCAALTVLQRCSRLEKSGHIHINLSSDTFIACNIGRHEHPQDTACSTSDRDSLPKSAQACCAQEVPRHC